MKKLHFDNDKKRNPILRLIIAIGAAFFVLGFFLEIPRSILIVVAILDLIAAIVETASMPQFRHKNYIQQDKFGINLRVNSMWSKRIAFNDVLLTELKNDTLILKKKYKKEMHINLKGFQEADIYRLYEIFLMNTKDNFQAKLQTR